MTMAYARRRAGLLQRQAAEQPRRPLSHLRPLPIPGMGENYFCYGYAAFLRQELQRICSGIASAAEIARKGGLGNAQFLRELCYGQMVRSLVSLDEVCDVLTDRHDALLSLPVEFHAGWGDCGSAEARVSFVT